MSNFIVGVVSSLVATALVAMAAAYGPGLGRRLFSDDVNLSGQWLSRLSTTHGQYTYSLQLTPFWTRWRGQATITRTSPTLGDYEHKLEVAARKRGSFVVLSLLGAKGQEGSIASGLIVLSDRGQTIDGAWAYRPSQSEMPETERLTFRRS